MKKLVLLCLMFCLFSVTIWAQNPPMVDVGSEDLEFVAPACIGNGAVRVDYRDGVPGQGGVKITFQSETDGFKRLVVSYDHAHMTGQDVLMRYYVNQPDDTLDGGENYNANNIANGRWGRYTEAFFVIPVKKGTNTFRLASVQGSAGWEFYVNRISYSKQTFATRDAVPKRYVDVPRPENIYGIIEMETLVNNEAAKLHDMEHPEDGYMYVNLSTGNEAIYEDIDFGKEKITSLRIWYQSSGSIPYIEIVLDNEKVIAEGNLKVRDMDATWTDTVFFFEPIEGVHDITIRVVYGVACLNRMQFGKETKTETHSTPLRDTKSDTWVAMDDLGRFSPVLEDVGFTGHSRSVGIFYFVWHQTKNGELFDHNAAYKAGGADAVWEEMAKGPQGYQHYWSRPYFGYYRSGDRWVIRKHATMLKNAGVDFIFFDNSNNICYPATLETIFDEWSQMRKDGIDTPQISFLFGDHEDRNNQQTTNIYYYFVKNGEYDDLWFRWEGKPLILGMRDAVQDETIRDTFNFRRSWAFNAWTGNGKNRWPWIAETTQLPGKGESGNIEQISVSCGFHASTSTGRSYHNGTQPTDGLGAFEFELETTPLGLAFAEQWQTAYEVQPPLVMITGWNEWWAGRWEGSGVHVANTYVSDTNDEKLKNHYVDNFNPEFSRDIEPEDGELGDNYYQQMMQSIRLYKGVRDIPTAYGAKDIDISGDFSQWEGVEPVYTDTLFDVTHRNEPAAAGNEVYVNETGRNDIDIARVSVFGDAVSFYVATREALQGADTESFMNLFINADGDYATGWQGYDYLVNRNRDGKTLSVEKHKEGYQWAEVYRASYALGQKELQVKIPLAVLEMSAATQYFDFKWADHSVQTDAVMGFYDLGDTAPDDRFNYRWRKAAEGFSDEVSGTLSAQSALVMKAGESTAFVGTIKKDITGMEPMMQGEHLLVPIRVVLENFGARIDVEDKRRMVTLQWKDQAYIIALDDLRVRKNMRTVVYDGIMENMGGRLYMDAEGLATLLDIPVYVQGDTLYMGSGIRTEHINSPY